MTVESQGRNDFNRDVYWLAIARENSEHLGASPCCSTVEELSATVADPDSLEQSVTVSVPQPRGQDFEMVSILLNPLNKSIVGNLWTA